ncbi:fibroblast growth factor receptor-like 1 isoform X2 [Haliotis cracherodii]|uniref:fibroblast growth factor receptor-like 1 isoform X2 n=1 Tax=Haliotis cracherodii TaxID=6455 RepID=UPI0039EA5A74
MTATVALFLVWVQMSAVAGTSLNLTQTSPQAFFGLSLQFKCALTTAGTSGALFFQRNTYVKCSVKRSDCTQYTSDTHSQTQYTCGCGRQSDGNYVYILNATSLHDDVEGNWRCEYRAFSNTINVTLTDSEGPTQIRLDKTEPQPKEGGSVNLTCSANCLPDCRYSWTKGGQDMTSRTRGSRGQVLALKGLVGDDSGNYTCTAVNPSSNKASDISAFLLVQTGPKRKDGASFTPTLRTSKGQTARLEATFTGDPRPELTWWKIEEGALTPVNNGAGETVRQDTPGRVGGSLTAVLEVKVETDDDMGMYCVSAENILDTTFVYIDLQGQQPMGAVCGQAEKGLPTFEIGVSVGLGSMFAIGIVVAVVFYIKYQTMKRELESPYASTSRRPSGMDSNHYQELPSPKMWRKQLQDGGYTLPVGDHLEVFSTKVDMRPVEGKVIATNAATNPVYEHISLYDDGTFPRQNSNCSTSSS